MCTVKVCEHGDIRLVDGGVDYEGRIEYCNDGIWGTICDADWTTSDAAVVCRQLGLPSEGEFNIDFICVLVCVPVSTSVIATTGAVAFAGGAFGGGIDRVVLATVECSGTEASLDKCPSCDTSSCSNAVDVGVRCIGKDFEPFASLLED